MTHGAASDMGKLSHIEDIEQRDQAAQAQAAEAVREHAASAVSAGEDMTAEEEEEFHGLDAKQPMSVGHKVLIVLAVVVVLVAMLYIVNSWIHFM